MRLFAVIRSRGACWQNDRTLEEQEEWDAHAIFMNRLHDAGQVVLGGPLEGTPEVLLIMRATGPAEVVQCLQPDPWTGLDLLRIARVTPWTLRLGTLPVAAN
jgi:hypothetical protein